MKFEVVKNVTLPVVPFNVGDVKFLRLDEKMYIGKKVEAKADATPDEKAKAEKKEPPTLCTVTNMETGELSTLVMNTVLRKEIEQNYPTQGYIGKTFRIEKMQKKAGKDYHGFSIQEVRLTAEVDAAAKANAEAVAGARNKK